MRLYQVTSQEAGEIVAAPILTTVDNRGNQVVTGMIGEGRMAELVVALDDPGLVITLIDRSARSEPSTTARPMRSRFS